jgi:hypothetical protein
MLLKTFATTLLALSQISCTTTGADVLVSGTQHVS